MTLMWWMLVSGFSAKTNSPSNNLRERGTEAQSRKPILLHPFIPPSFVPFSIPNSEVTVLYFLSCLNR